MQAIDSHQPIEKRIEWALKLATDHANSYNSPGEQIARRLYKAEHPTRVIVLKCMDGRVHIPVASETPLGSIIPFRNLGGRFHLGWPHLGELITEKIFDAVDQGRKVLVLINYHFSRSHHEWGCAGFGYDCAAAIDHTFELRSQFEKLFGEDHSVVYPLVCGFETDEDALLLHGENGEVLDLAEESQWNMLRILSQLEHLFPTMPRRIQLDLLPIIEGNINHIAKTRKSDRQLFFEHREWVLGIGRGFDFLHIPNVALIVGPYSPNLSTPIHTAGKILHNNMKSGRIGSDGFCLLSSAVYRDSGVERARAEMKSRFLGDYAARVIERELPELSAKMTRLEAVVDGSTRRLELLPSE